MVCGGGMLVENKCENIENEPSATNLESQMSFPYEDSATELMSDPAYDFLVGNAFHKTEDR